MHSHQLSWLQEPAESKRWLDALKTYRTVECAVTAPLQQVGACARRMRAGHTLWV